VHQHATSGNKTFTGKYHINRLVHVEVFCEPKAAIEREKQIKRWKREKKIALVDSVNPAWKTIDVT
jgi:putative endonuclease